MTTQRGSTLRTRPSSNARYDVVVIGSGPGGLAAAISAKKAGADEVLIVERDQELGGILLQCIHNGFGLEIFGEDLPGPSYAQRFIDDAKAIGIDTRLDTMVLEIDPVRTGAQTGLHRTAGKLYVTSSHSGFAEIETKAIVLAMGCRERTRAQIQIPGSRPAGVYSAGTAQRWVNVEGYMPGKRVVILGSGDIGMIMARRLTFEGAKVERMLEVMPYLTGLSRNYVQCLLDFDIPLQLQHTVKRILGKDRVEAVEAVAVDERRQPIPGTEELIPCDTLLLSVGLIPENELSQKVGVRLDPITGGPYVDEGYQTNIPGIYAAGNVVHVYDLVDWVTEAGQVAGERAACYAMGTRCLPDAAPIPTRAGDHVRYVVPHTLNPERLTESDVRLQMRVTEPIEQPVRIQVVDGERLIAQQGARYARPGEMVNITLRRRDYEKVRTAQELRVSVIPR